MYVFPVIIFFLALTFIWLVLHFFYYWYYDPLRKSYKYKNKNNNLNNVGETNMKNNLNVTIRMDKMKEEKLKIKEEKKTGRMKATFKRFKDFKSDCDFMTKIGEDRIINITTASRVDIFCTVFYWYEREKKNE